MNRRHAVIVSSFLLLIPPAAKAQTGPAHMVRDINSATQTSLSGSSPFGIVECGGRAFFTAFTLETGRELWKSDGTDAGTVLVKDIHPGPGDSNVRGPLAVDGTLFFFADDGIHGDELWKSDGTEAGTVLVKDIRPGPDGSLLWPASPLLIAVSGTVFLVADDGIHGAEIWKSDGTEAGTVLLKDINPGRAGSAATDWLRMTAVGRTLFFVADDGTRGYELWKSDGTEAGTSLVFDSWPGPYGGMAYSSPFAFNGVVMFWALDGVDGYDLWRSDGSESGTYRLADLQQGEDRSGPWNIGRVGSFMYFATHDDPDATDSPLWRTDGTLAGTSIVGSVPNLDGALGAEYQGQLYFSAYSYPDHTPQLWRIDTEGGAVKVSQFANGAYGGGIGNFIEYQGDLFFTYDPGDLQHVELWKTSGNTTTRVKVLRRYGVVDFTVAGGVLVFPSFDDEHGFELWKSDGTTAGTSLLKDIRPGPINSSDFHLVSIHGVVFFAADDGVHFNELWKSDGTEGGTTLVKDINPLIFTESSNPAGMVVSGRNVFFAATTEATGTELWVSDGTEAGTRLVKDIWRGPGWSFPGELTVVGDTVFFRADDYFHGPELWRSDGTEAGTMMVRDIVPGPRGAFPNTLNVAYGSLFFAADDGIHGQELWKSDGTEAGTILVKDINPGPASSYPLEEPGENPILLFDADDGVHGYELWKSDGTEAGTVLVKDINPGPGSSYSGRAYAVNGGYVFSAEDGVHGREPWRTDGSDAGTRLLKDINEGEDDSTFSWMAQARGLAFFPAWDGLKRYNELWRTDGTEDGTFVVRGIPSGTSPSVFDLPATVGDTLFFTAYDHPNERPELWKSDGTDAVLVKHCGAAYMTTVADTLFFFGFDESRHLPALWRSDGTESGTFAVQDFPSYWRPNRGTTAVGNHLFFSAYDFVHGNEPWSGRSAILAAQPDRAIRDLREEVVSLGLNHGIEQSLTVKLDAAADALARGAVADAIRRLEVFAKEVRALPASKISEASGESLLEFEQEITGLLSEDR